MINSLTGFNCVIGDDLGTAWSGRDDIHISECSLPEDIL